MTTLEENSNETRIRAIIAKQCEIWSNIKLDNDVNAEEIDVQNIVTDAMVGCKQQLSNAELSEFVAQTAYNHSSLKLANDRLAASIRIYNRWFEDDLDMHYVSRKVTFKNCVKMHRFNKKNCELKYDIDADYSTIEDDDKFFCNLFYENVLKYGDELEKYIDYNRNFKFDSFALSSVLPYLLINDKCAECPQQCYMRVALHIFGEEVSATGNYENVIKYYNMLSTHVVSNASPTMYNSGLKYPQLSSCFQISAGDSIESMYDVISAAAVITKRTGGISINVSNIRSHGAEIGNSSGKTASGLVNYIEVIEKTRQHVAQNRGRPGAIAIYISVDHTEIVDIINMRSVTGNGQNLFYAMWVSDYFMQKLELLLTTGEDSDWYLFDPKRCPGLNYCFNQEYINLYNEYVSKNLQSGKVKISTIMTELHKVWQTKGGIYFMYKDHINNKSNMKNVGPICSANLCTEIIIPSWSSDDIKAYQKFHPGNTEPEIGVCNLCSICLPAFVNSDNTINYAALIETAGFQTLVLNNIIDITLNPTAMCERSNKRHRPIGIGIMGLADLLNILRIPYDTKDARDVAKNVMSAIYYGALKKSIELAKVHGSYSTFPGSPASKGILTPDMWNIKNWEDKLNNGLTREMWGELRGELKNGYLRNAYLIACMPTATTANVAGFNESFEPRTSNLYLRKGKFGEYYIRNNYLIKDLKERTFDVIAADESVIKKSLWNKRTMDDIIRNDGSVRTLTMAPIPEDIQNLYKTAREIDPDNLLKMSQIISIFTCQSISMNMFLQECKLSTIATCLLSGWKLGLKTGLYYCHITAKTGAHMGKAEPEKDICHGCT